MEEKDQELVERLISENNELKTLWKEHQKYEQQLEKLDRKNFLTPADRQEKKRLQLAKLAGKTRIEQILVKFRE
ncbi:MAG: DUF465 domain-containing protein [bacterium]